MEWGGGRWRGARFENGRHHDIKPFWVPGGIDLFRTFLLSLFAFFVRLEARRNDDDLFAALRYGVPPEMHTHCRLFRC